MSINRRLGESEGFKGKGFECILRLLGFVTGWYIDLVDVAGYTDVDWPRVVMNRASLPERSPLLSPSLQSALPALAHAHAKAQLTELYLHLHRKAECRRRLDRDETYLTLNLPTIAVP